jgi:hypothetical protein
LEPVLDYIRASSGREKRAVARNVQSKAGPSYPKMITFDDMVSVFLLVAEEGNSEGWQRRQGTPDSHISPHLNFF